MKFLVNFIQNKKKWHSFSFRQLKHAFNIYISDLALRLYFIWKQLNFLMHIHLKKTCSSCSLDFFLGWWWRWTMSQLSFYQSALLPFVLLHEVVYQLHQTFTDQWSAINFNNEVVALGTGFGVIHWFTQVCVYTWSRQDTELYFYN